MDATPPFVLMRSSRPPSTIAGRPEQRQEISDEFGVLERTAIHEAGHAAVYLALGIELHSTTVRADASTGAQGLPVAVVRGRVVAILEEYTSPLVIATASYAGCEAVRRWNPDRLDWKRGADSDFTDAEECIVRAAGPFSLRNEYAVRLATLRFRARTVAEVLVRDHWQAIKDLAAELMRAETLHGDEVAWIFQRTAIRAAAAEHLLND